MFPFECADFRTVDIGSPIPNQNLADKILLSDFETRVSVELRAIFLAQLSKLRPDLVEPALAPFENFAGEALSGQNSSWFRDAAASPFFHDRGFEPIVRERHVVERRIKQAKFPAIKSLDTFYFTAIPSLNKMLVLELARCEFILRRENVIALGNSGTGKTHVAFALGLAACQKGFSAAFTTAAAMVHQLMEARDQKRLLKLQRDLQAVKLLIVDEFGYVPLSPTGAEPLFVVLSQRYERGATVVTSNLPFEDWT